MGWVVGRSEGTGVGLAVRRAVGEGELPVSWSFLVVVVVVVVIIVIVEVKVELSPPLPAGASITGRPTITSAPPEVTKVFACLPKPELTTAVSRTEEMTVTNAPLITSKLAGSFHVAADTPEQEK